MVRVTLLFKGGAELLFDGVKERRVDVPSSVSHMRQLLPWMRDNLCTERPELFASGDSVRPGILVLINDADWELEGQLDYELQANDEILFISTLHGG